MSFADLQARNLTSPAYEYSLTKDIPIADLKLSASAHRDSGTEVSVGSFMLYQYTKYEEELRRRAQGMHQSNSSSAGGTESHGLELRLDESVARALFPGTIGMGDGDL